MTTSIPKFLQLIVLLLVMALQSCGHLAKPDLDRLYQESRETRRPPVILIHGLMGSRLEDLDTGKEIWVGNLVELTFSHYHDTALEIDPKTLLPKPSRQVATGMLDHVIGKDFYAGITNTLESAGGYSRAELGTAQSGKTRNYYVFVYDWRQDMVQSARKLSHFIQQIQIDYHDPELKVDLVAHSMGGLIARYYLRYGEEDTLDDNDFKVNLYGAKRVRRIILLGTPNLGTVTMLQSFIAGFRMGIRRVPPEVLATMPSLYQLFPHALSDWIATTDGKPLDRDLYDVNVWRQFHWSIFDPRVRKRIMDRFASKAGGTAYLKLFERYFEKHLERARRFTWSLTVPLPARPYQLIVMGGDCKLTPARIVVEEVKGVSEVRLWPRQISHPVAGVDYKKLMLEPGDGRVTKASLIARASLDPSLPRNRWVSFPLDYPIFLCEGHENLTSNSTFQDSLLHTLLSLDKNF